MLDLVVRFSKSVWLFVCGAPGSKTGTEKLQNARTLIPKDIGA